MRARHILLLVLLISISAQAAVITHLRNGVSTFYYDVDDLVAIVQSNCIAGDTLILPGGPINLDGSLVIDKRVALIGAGVLNSGTSVTGVTTLIGTWTTFGFETVSIASAGAGSSFHGINFDLEVQFYGFGNNAPTFSAYFTRCSFLSTLSLGTWDSPTVPPAASNVHVKHCILYGGVVNGGSTGPQNFLLENSIVEGNIVLSQAGISSALVLHCILLDMVSSSGGNNGVTFTNNVITRSAQNYNLNSASTYNNNLFCMGFSPGGLTWNGASNGGGNIGTASSLNSVFINVGSYVDFDEAYDYHLTSNSIGSGMGVPVGTDVGIYDGPQGSPWKEDAIPFNPHWLSLSPSLGTSVGGVVNVNLSGEAQPD